MRSTSINFSLIFLVSTFTQRGFSPCGSSQPPKDLLCFLYFLYLSFFQHYDMSYFHLPVSTEWMIIGLIRICKDHLSKERNAGKSLNLRNYLYLPCFITICAYEHFYMWICVFQQLCTFLFIHFEVLSLCYPVFRK